jgi:hypothetical protein
MRYPDDANVKSPPVTGAQVPAEPLVVTYQPSTWRLAPERFDQTFHATLEKIFNDTMLDELRNVVEDIEKARDHSPSSLVHRGHVVAVAYMCALDAISTYGYKGQPVKKFVKAHFPAVYRPYASRIYRGYRNHLVHAWNLFGNAALLPGNDDPSLDRNGVLQFGILNFALAFEKAVHDFLAKLKTDVTLQERALYRYRVLTGEIDPPEARRGGS